MATPSARFAIGFDADTSGITQSKSALDSLKATIEKDTKALTEMKGAMERLKGTAEVTRFQALPKDIKAAESELKKLQSEFANIGKRYEKNAAAGKVSSLKGLFEQGLGKSAEIDKATRRMSALKEEQEKLGKTEPVKLFKDVELASKKLQGTLGTNQIALSRMGGTMEKAKEPAQDLKGVIKEFIDEQAKAGGAAGSFAQGLQKVAKNAGLIAVALAVVALVTGIVFATVETVAFAIAMSDAAHSAALLREANAVGSASANDLKSATQGVLDKTNAQEEAVSSLVGEYSRLRLTLTAIEGATSAVTVATQAAGAAAGSTIKGLIDRGVDTKRFWLNALDLKGTGLAFRDVSTQLAKQMKISVGAAEAALRDGRVKLEDGIKALDASVESRFGEVARRQMLALPTQMERLKKNLAGLFSGTKIEGFLEQLNDSLSIFKETSAVGKALKQILTVALQPFIDSATAGMPLVEGFVYGVVLALQELTIIGLKVAIAFKKMFGGSVLKDMDMIKMGAYAGAAALVILIGVVGGLIAVFAALGTVVVIATAPIWLLPAAIAAAIAGLIALKDKIKSALSGGASEAGAGDAGTNITDGVVKGIQDGTPAVDAAMKDMAKSGVKAFESELKIASPSKVLAATSEIGIGGGVVKGVDESRPAVSQALARLVDPADVDTSSAGQTLMARAQTAAGNVINVVLNYYGAGTRSDAVRFRDMLSDEIEPSRLASGQPA